MKLPANGLIGAVLLGLFNTVGGAIAVAAGFTADDPPMVHSILIGAGLLISYSGLALLFNKPHGWRICLCLAFFGLGSSSWLLLSEFVLSGNNPGFNHLVEVHLDDLARLVGSLAMVLYLRRAKVCAAYAHPVGGTPHYHAMIAGWACFALGWL